MAEKVDAYAQGNSQANILCEVDNILSAKFVAMCGATPHSPNSFI